jgi:hypothetical protein
MKRFTAMRMLLATLATVILLVGCGGGGGSTSQTQGVAPSDSATMLAWTPPSTYNDNVALDPERDLVYYEIYVRLDPNFTDNDLPAVQVAAVTDVLSRGGLVERTPVTEFNLELIPSLPAGSQLYVSMRAVGIDQQKSAFMAPLTWDRS